MLMSDQYSRKHLKLKKIKDNIHFPGNHQVHLPYLGKEVSTCSSVFKYGDCDLEVDEEVENDLTKMQSINWCRTVHTLHPIKTAGQGSQLLQAVSVALWSFPDGANLLHRLLFVFVSEFGKDAIFERWIRSEDSKSATVEHGFQSFLNATRFQSEGEKGSPPELASVKFPHPLHIFVISNLLRRPIIVVGDENEIKTGLYLPLLWRSEDCIKWPITFAFYNGLYFPLVFSEEDRCNRQKMAEFAIPLVSSNLQPLKIMCLSEAEESEAFLLLQRYLNTTEINLTRFHDICLILSAKLTLLPFEYEDVPVAGSASELEATKALEQSSLNQLPFGNIVPTAPSASIVTLNNLSGALSHPEERETSMLNKKCQYLGCNLYASRYTDPFCWDHVGQRENSLHQIKSERSNSEYVEVSMVNERCKEGRCSNFASRFIYPYCYEHMDKKTVDCMVKQKHKQNNILPAESSIVMEHCHHGNCRNYASQYIYPFCYEHLDERSIFRGSILNASIAANEQAAVSKDYDISVMAEQCAHPNCNNHASKYTFPVCYEHLDSPLAITRAAAATKTLQIPYRSEPSFENTTSRLLNGGQRQAVALTTTAAREAIDVDKKFEEMMKELEARTRNGVLCLNDGCNNFGNGKSRGYCHSCFKLINQL